MKRREVLAAAALWPVAGAARADSPVSAWVEPAASEADGDVVAVLREAIRKAAPRSHELEALTPAAGREGAVLRLAPHVERIAQPRDSARLVLSTAIEVRPDALAGFLLACRSETSVVLPNHGEGGWDEEGHYALRSALARCARDITLLLQTELSMRRRGYWTANVGNDRLLEVRLAHERSARECLVIRETGASLFLAEADAEGRLSGNRLIVDKPLLA